MVDSSNKKRKELISEGDIATLFPRYDTFTILRLLQEVYYHAEPKMDWNELVKKTTTGITNAREYQRLWRHLAYGDSLLPVEDNAQLQDDDNSDMECEVEASPAVSVDAVSEAVAYVKVMAASYVPSDSDIPEDSTVEAPLTINIPYGLHKGAQEPSDSYWSSRGMNITFPVSLQKSAEGLNGNGLTSSVASRKRRKKWSAEEDEELIAAVKRHGEGSWALIAKEEFEAERTPSQLSQRWGAIRRRCDTSNSATQSGLQRTEAQMAANRALSLAVGNRVPSKKLAVGIPPMLSSGTITGTQANGTNSGSSLQAPQQSQPVVQALPRAATSAQTAKSRVPAKKTTANSTSRAELMVTANSVAAAACMSGLATTTSVPKAEPGKNAVAALVPKAEPGKNAVAALVPKAEPGKNTVAALVPKDEPIKTASTAPLPHPPGIISASKAEPVKTASAVVSLPRPSGVISASRAEPVKTASAVVSLPRPSGVISASKAEPVKTASAAVSLPRPSGVISASKAEPVKIASAASLPRPSGVIAALKVEPVKTTSAASLPRPSSIPPAPKAEPVKSVAAATTNIRAVGPSNIRQAVNGTLNHVISLSPSNKPSPLAPLSKGPTIQNNSVPSGFASSRLVSTPRIPAATVISQQPSPGPVVSVQKEQSQGNKASPLATTAQPNKTISTNSAINTGKLMAAKVDMPNKNPLVQTCSNKSLLDNKPLEKENKATISPVTGPGAVSKLKDEVSKGKTPEVATMAGTEQPKGL